MDFFSKTTTFHSIKMFWDVDSNTTHNLNNKWACLCADCASFNFLANFGRILLTLVNLLVELNNGVKLKTNGLVIRYALTQFRGKTTQCVIFIVITKQFFFCNLFSSLNFAIRVSTFQKLFLVSKINILTTTLSSIRLSFSVPFWVALRVIRFHFH